MSNTHGSEMVDRPKHYNHGKIEAISVIEDWKLGFNLGSTIKYICRAGLKNPYKEIEDLEKAVWYLQREIQLLKAKENKQLEFPLETEYL